MTYLLDSNAVIALSKAHPVLINRLKHKEPGEVAISSIVAHELCYGAFKSERVAANLASFERFRFKILAFDASDARRAGEVRAALGAKGTPIGPFDTLIAGQTVARGLILITRNIREFGRVADLQVENWED